jgi:hypothetical protein
MKTFHNDQKIKDKYVARVQSHMEADAIIQGTGWENGKGCAVGCTLENYNPKQYEIELGIPNWLAHLEDRIFEGLPNKEAQKFPLQFLQSMPVGVSVEDFYKLRCDLDYKRLAKLLKNLTEENNEWGVKAAIEECMRLNGEYTEAKDDKWSAARAAAWSAVRGVAESARAAAESAAWSAVRGVAESARAAAESAAWSAAWQFERDNLLEALKKLK